MKLTSLLVLGFLAGASVASAQTHQEEGFFIQGGALAAIERRSHADIDANDLLALIAPDDGGSTAAAGVVGAGIFLRPFLSARANLVLTGDFEAGFPAAITGGLIPPTGGEIFRQLSRSQTRNAELHALLAYHLPSERRFRLALLAGVSFTRQRTHFSSDLFIATVPTLPGVTRSAPTRQIDYSFVSYRRDLVIGVDGEFALGEKFALIPELRLVGGSGSIGIRPGVVIRWHP